MKSILRSLGCALRHGFRGRADLLVEVAALRQQLAVYQRQTPRPRLCRRDRLFWIWLCRHWAGWRSGLVIVNQRRCCDGIGRATAGTGANARRVGLGGRGYPADTSSSFAESPPRIPDGERSGSLSNWSSSWVLFIAPRPFVGTWSRRAHQRTRHGESFSAHTLTRCSPWTSPSSISGTTQLDTS